MYSLPGVQYLRDVFEELLLEYPAIGENYAGPWETTAMWDAFAREYLKWNRSRRDRAANARFEEVNDKGGLLRLKKDDILRIVFATEKPPSDGEEEVDVREDGILVRLSGSFAANAIHQFTHYGRLNRDAALAAEELRDALSAKRLVPRSAPLFWGAAPPKRGARGAKRLWGRLEFDDGGLVARVLREPPPKTLPGELWIYAVAAKVASTEVRMETMAEGVREMKLRLGRFAEVESMSADFDWDQQNTIDELARQINGHREIHELTEMGVVDPAILEKAGRTNDYYTSGSLTAIVRSIAEKGRFPLPGDRFESSTNEYHWGRGQLLE
jgi:hypothetical protein